MLAEALRLLPPLKSWLHDEPDQLFDLDDPLNNHGFRSFTVSSRRSSPKKFMLGGRRRDVKAVFDALPFGSFWYVKRFKEDGNWSKVWIKLGRARAFHEHWGTKTSANINLDRSNNCVVQCNLSMVLHQQCSRTGTSQYFWQRIKNEGCFPHLIWSICQFFCYDLLK